MEKYNEYLDKILNEEVSPQSEYEGFKVGDKVKVKKTIESIGNMGQITTDYIGIIKSFLPKAKIDKGDIYDDLPYQAYIIFYKTNKKEHKYSLRSLVNIINLKKINF